MTDNYTNCYSGSAVATGNQIFNAAIKGALRGYNRSTDDYAAYASMLYKEYELMIKSIKDIKYRKSIIKNTNRDPFVTYFTIYKAMNHGYIGTKPSEMHVRVFLHHHPFRVFDITTDDWNNMCEISAKLLSDEPSN